LAKEISGQGAAKDGGIFGRLLKVGLFRVSLASDVGIVKIMRLQ
jgi:hypothetical protein